MTIEASRATALLCTTVGLWIVATPSPGQASEGSPVFASVQTTSSTTAEAERDRWSRAIAPHPEPELNLGRLMLQLPAHFVELAFAPLLPVAAVFERYHVVDRFVDLVTNAARTLALVPLVEPFSSSGVGVGAAFLYNDPLGSPDRLSILGLVRPNRDRDITLSMNRRLPILSGREFGFSAGYSVDHDDRFFGLGTNTSPDDQRLMRTDAVNAQVELTLLNPSELPEWEAAVAVAYRRRRLSTGNGPQAPALTRNDLVVRPPPGFGRSLDFPELTLRTTYDSRDSEGRTTRGFFADLQLSVTSDTNGLELSGARLQGQLAAFIPILPLFRVLFLSVGAAGSARVFHGEELPLHFHSRLGGSNTLRGYRPRRFVDRLAWWATAEYRFRFYEYAGSSMQISSAVFVDTGHVGDAVSELVTGPFPYSIGLGLRFEQNLVLLGRLQIAYSPEGFRLTVGSGDLL